MVSFRGNCSVLTLRSFVSLLPSRFGAEPIPYPYTIALTGNNAAITDIELLNSYNGVSAVHAARHYIARIQGQPTNIGIFIDQVCDGCDGCVLVCWQ